MSVHEHAHERDVVEFGDVKEADLVTRPDGDVCPRAIVLGDRPALLFG